jgi:hypothetical protein
MACSSDPLAERYDARLLNGPLIATSPIASAFGDLRQPCLCQDIHLSLADILALLGMVVGGGLDAYQKSFCVRALRPSTFPRERNLRRHSSTLSMCQIGPEAKAATKNGLGQISALLSSRSATQLVQEYSEHSWVTSALTNQSTCATCVPIFEVGHWPASSITSDRRTSDVAAKLKCQH